MMVPRSILHHCKHCTRVYQGVLLSSPLKIFNKAVSQQICKKYNWQHASTKLAKCTAHVDRAKSATACITSLRIVGKNYFGRFYIPVSTPTAKFNHFRLYGILHLPFQTFLSSYGSVTTWSERPACVVWLLSLCCSGQPWAVV